MRAPPFSIILAAGKGTRMRSAACHKVCFPVAGKPAIHRALERYNACGIGHHVLVVGALAGQVVETVGQAFQNVSFVYQSEQRGTAHATRIGLSAIEARGGDPAVLVAAGDRIIEPTVLEKLFSLFYGSGCDLALLVTPRRPGSTQGRVLTTSSGDLLGKRAGRGRAHPPDAERGGRRSGRLLRDETPGRLPHALAARGRRRATGPNPGRAAGVDPGGADAL